VINVEKWMLFNKLKLNPIRFAPTAILVFGILSLTASSSWAAGKTVDSFFNTTESSSKNLKPFKKWTAALGRYSKEVKNRKKVTCKSARLNICDYGDWATFLKGLKGKKTIEQIRAVNDQMNKAKYVTDQSNWGHKDYWATPGEFMTRFGDCEDYAIVKYLSLRALGIPDKNLRVVAVKDLNLKVGHAILMVIFKDKKTGKNRYLVLDNQIKQVVDSRKIRHYQPVFSINKTQWWRHLPKVG